MASQIKQQKKQILVIDDEQSLTQMLSMMLGTRGYDVVVAHTASEGLQKVSSQIDLILLDLVLPDSDGLSVCSELKNNKNTAHVPVIMMSAHSLDEDKVQGLYLGADDFLPKPCEAEELVARMEAVMRRGRNGAGVKREEEIICELRKIFDEQLIVPYFQPIYNLKPFELYGVEILTRPTSTSVLANPEEFFKAAFQYGMYLEMEILSWSMALNILSRYFTDEKIFLNCNPYLIEMFDPERVLKVFDDYKVSPRNVIMEITERSTVSDYKVFYERLAIYRKAGFSFAIDDVGGGYASLESIVEIKPEILKIDRHIVTDISDDVFKQSIVKFVVSFCKENGIFSVAEGIETNADLQAIKDMGVNSGQGFYLYKPTSQIDLSEFTKIKF